VTDCTVEATPCTVDRAASELRKSAL